MRATRFVVLSLMACSSIACGPKAQKPAKETPKVAKAAPKTDQGMLGDLHKANVGSIVFATQEIPKDADESFPNTTEVSVGDSVWARAYFGKSPHNTYAVRGTSCPIAREWKLRVKIGSGEVIILDGNKWKAAEWNKWTTLVPRTGKDQWLWGEKRVSYPTDQESIDMKLAQLFHALPNGDHDLAFDLKASCKKSKTAKEAVRTLAKGLLKVKIDDESRKKLTENVGPYLVPNALEDEGEVARLRRAAAKSFADGKILEFRLLESAWRVNRNDAGVPRHRQILSASVVERAGKCEIAGLEIKEEALGGSSYGQPTFTEPAPEANLKKVPIPCVNATKTATEAAPAPPP